MVAVVVGDAHSLDILGLDAIVFERFHYLLGVNAGIDKDSALVGAYIGAVSAATASETDESEKFVLFGFRIFGDVAFGMGLRHGPLFLRGEIKH